LLALEKFWEKLRSLADSTYDSDKSLDSYKTESLLSDETVDFLRRIISEPTNLQLYQTALTHRSVVHDQPTQRIIESNQRLEFLGDSVLGLLISEYLFRTFPEYAEGELSNNRAKIVNSKSLSGFAQSLGIGHHLLVAESANHQKISCSESALADAFESLIGAIYLDKGIKIAYNFILKHVIEHPGFTTIIEAEHNYKSRLIEYTQLHHFPQPLYTVMQESGAEHEKTFTVSVTCNNEFLGSGTARRKKDAEQLAAREAMQRIAIAEKEDLPL
jgi:ribonuclease-3